MENNPDNQTIPFRVIPGCTGKEKYKIMGEVLQVLRRVTGWCNVESPCIYWL